MIVTVVVPCYNESEALPFFVTKMADIAQDLEPWLDEPLSFVFVDDGSTDGTLELLRDMHDRVSRCHYISFSRNFGKEAALLAGMRKALDLSSTHVAVMDADLQDPPELLPEMCRIMSEKGCDAVAAYRESREGEPIIRSWFARRFYSFMERVSDAHMRDGARDFRLMTRRMVDEVCSMQEVGRFSKGLFMWVGHQTEWVGYQNIEREHGSTSWSFWGLVRYALEGIIAFSTWPLEAISIIGVIVSILAVLFLFFIFFRALFFGDPVAGWPSMMCVIILLGGIQILGIGVIGLYLAKTYHEVKRRPVYLVAEEE